jgi:Flp pilus assembly protein CpaB
VTRRGRGVALLGLAAACAGLAVSLVNGYARDVRAQVGPLVPVAVARADLPRGKLITPASLPRLLATRRVPERFVPPRAVEAPSEALGYRTATRLDAGAYVTEAALVGPGAGRGRGGAGVSSGGPGRGAVRAVEVQVSGGGGLAGALRPGALVDVLVTSDRGGGSPRTYLALQRVDVLDARPADGGEGGSGGADTAVVLNVSLREALVLTAAQNFGRELRLVAREPSDRRTFPPMAVSADDLRP